MAALPLVGAVTILMIVMVGVVAGAFFALIVNAERGLPQGSPFMGFPPPEPWQNGVQNAALCTLRVVPALRGPAMGPPPLEWSHVQWFKGLVSRYGARPEVPAQVYAWLQDGYTVDSFRPITIAGPIGGGRWQARFRLPPASEHGDVPVYVRQVYGGTITYMPANLAAEVGSPSPPDDASTTRCTLTADTEVTLRGISETSSWRPLPRLGMLLAHEHVNP